MADEARGALQRIRGWLGLTAPQVPMPGFVDDGTLRVLGGSSDPAASDSAVLNALRAAGETVDLPLLVRHHLLLPDADAVERVRAVVAQESYAVLAEAPADADADAEGQWRVRVSRVEVPEGRVLARERTRMAGLAQRNGGNVAGWDLCGR